MTATIERHKSGKIAYVTEVGGNGEVLKFGEPGVAFTKEQCEKVAGYNDGRANLGELRIIDPKGKVLKTVVGPVQAPPAANVDVTAATLKEQVAHLQAENERIRANQPRIAGLIAQVEAAVAEANKWHEQCEKVAKHYNEFASLVTDEEGPVPHADVVKLLTDIVNENEAAGENAAEVVRLREENVKLKADLAAAEELATGPSVASGVGHVNAKPGEHLATGSRGAGNDHE